VPKHNGKNKGLGVGETGADSQYRYLKCSKSAFRHLKLINQGGIIGSGLAVGSCQQCQKQQLATGSEFSKRKF